MKPQTIIFEGVDKSGKSSLKAAFDKAVKFKHWTIDRGPLSHVCYNIIYNRHIQNENVNNITDVCKHAVLVYVYAETDMLQARIDICKHEKIDVKRDKKMFEEMLSALGHLFKDVIVIDTSELSIAACVHELIKAINEID